MGLASCVTLSGYRKGNWTDRRVPGKKKRFRGVSPSVHTALTRAPKEPLFLCRSLTTRLEPLKGAYQALVAEER